MVTHSTGSSRMSCSSTRARLGSLRRWRGVASSVEIQCSLHQYPFLVYSKKDCREFPLYWLCLDDSLQSPYGWYRVFAWGRGRLCVAEMQWRGDSRRVNLTRVSEKDWTGRDPKRKREWVKTGMAGHLGGLREATPITPAYVISLTRQGGKC